LAIYNHRKLLHKDTFAAVRMESPISPVHTLFYRIRDTNKIPVASLTIPASVEHVHHHVTVESFKQHIAPSIL